MEKLLQGQRAIVTGGEGGIGKSIVTKFINHGAKVAVLGINEQSGQDLIEEFSAQGFRDFIAFYRVDASRSDQVDEGVKKVLEEFGSIDILVNNAGITRDGLLMRMSEEDWDAVLTVNLKSCFNLCKALIRPMIKNRHGKIINMASVIGLTGNAGQVNYASSKAGMIGFSKSLAREVSNRNINVNCIAPGYIDTPMTQKLSEQQKQRILEQIPAGRMGQVEDIANAALFLASGLADYITGQVLTVDGGMVM